MAGSRGIHRGGTLCGNAHNGGMSPTLPPLRRLSYISRVADGVTQTEMRAIWGMAEVFHRRMDLTGVLAYTGEHLFQVIEGDPHALDQLFAVIQADPRHGDLRVLCDEAIQTRRFDRWHGTVVDSLDLADQAAALARSPAGCEQARDFAERLLQHAGPDTQV
jgi:hypothetical protein